MTQPAKVQEPSMEEILASIRRIIADDEAKPADAKPADAVQHSGSTAGSAPSKPAMTGIPPSSIPAAQAAAAKSPPAAAKPASPPPASNSQDDIDAMLASLDETTSEEEIRPPLPDGEVFELTDAMALPESPSSGSFQKVEPHDDLEFAETPVAGPSPAIEPRRPPLEAPGAEPSAQILSRSTVSAVESAFNSLANTVLSNNARTLEDLVKEMLRPMLKSWLDDNLPGLVERIVKAEIERVSRGR